MRKKVLNIKRLIFGILAAVLLLNGGIFAQTITLAPKVSPTPTSAETKLIENLKEKVANKVAEIRKKNNKAVAGTVINISPTTFTIKAQDGQNYDIKLDDALTKYYKISGTTQKEIKTSDIEKNNYVIVAGVISDRTVSANSIFVDQPYLVTGGKISQVDKENYQVKVIASDKTVYTLNIENITKQQIVNIKTLEIEKVGFSKIIEGDSIHFTAKVTGNEKDNTYSAEKTLIVPQEYFLK